jgi:thiol-disulfide isomerase/thioredoxin
VYINKKKMFGLKLVIVVMGVSCMNAFVVRGPSSSTTTAATITTTTGSMKVAVFGGVSRRHHLLSAHATLDSRPSSSSSRGDFESRMRKLLNGRVGLGGNRRKIQSEPSSDIDRRVHGLPTNFHVVQTLQEYKEVVGDEKEKIVCTRFFAPWCKACKAVQPYYFKLAREYPNVKFVDVPVTEKNTDLHQGLQVPSLPYGHIYHPEAGLVEELRISKKFFHQFEEALRSIVSGSCNLLDGDVENPFASQFE